MAGLGKRHACMSPVAKAPKTRRRASLPIARVSIISLILGVMWLSLAAFAATDPRAASADQKIEFVAQETTTVPVEDESTDESTDESPDESPDVTEETGTTATTESSETTAETAPLATVSWWQWLLAGALVIGAGSVIKVASNRPPDPATIGLDAQSLLAHYQEIAATIARATPSQEGYAYELGVLDTLAPRLDDLIEAAQSDSRRGLLAAVRSRASEAVEAIRTTAPEKGGLAAQLLVHQAGAAMERAIQRARAEF
jgi:hypothetical protein